MQLSSAAALTAALKPVEQAFATATGEFKGTLCLFSKSVPQLKWQELAQHAKAAGFGGIDLTVRRDGHVMPSRAAEDLPKAVAAIRAEGLEVPMITTELLTENDPTAEPIIRTAADLHIPFLKPGYYHYQFIDVRKELAAAGEQFRGLVGLAAKHGVQVGFHNHAGYIGCQLWDIASVMDTLDPRYAGYYYDLDNAAMEGGVEGWRIAANLVIPRLKMMGVKDFIWRKTEKKGWQPTNCPLGQGMCKYAELLKMVAATDFHGPVSLHMEYEIPRVSNNQGIALSRETDDQVMVAAQRDLETLKALLRTAYAGA
jgi:L-ribulose-5-phosphate 3-epimerase